MEDCIVSNDVHRAEFVTFDVHKHSKVQLNKLTHKSQQSDIVVGTLLH